jgi:capsular exopolysaccharide synthesis family protein
MSGQQFINGMRGDAVLKLAEPRLDEMFLRPVEREFTWEQAVRVLRKNVRLTVLVSGAVTLGVILLALSMKDVYQPVARLEIVPLNSGIKSLQESEESQTTDQDYLETQSQILRSDALATSVIRDLHLDKNPEFAGRGTQAKLVQPQDSPETRVSGQGKDTSFLQEQFELVDRTPSESMALEAFRQHLTVNRVRNSRLVEVSFQSHDPRLAQSVTNTLITEFMDQNYRHRYASTMRASEWLSSQLSDLRQRVQEANQAVADYQKRYGLVEADERDVPLAQLMNDVNHQLSEAQANRIEAEAYVRMIDLGQSEAIPAVRDDQVYQNLMTRYADVRAQLAQARTVYGDENSNVKKLENESSELGAQVEAERMRMVGQVRTSFAAARDRETMMLDAREKLKAQMGDASSHMVVYRVLRNDAVAKAELYNTLQARLREAGIFAGLRSSNISVVDLAPQLVKPTGPHRNLVMAGGAFLSLFLGIVLAFVKESFNNTVRTPDEVRDWTGLPSLGMLPTMNGAKPGQTRSLVPGKLGLLENHSNGVETLPRALAGGSRTAEAEAMKYLRSGLLFCKPSAPPKIVLVSSATANEGKTTVAINLAAALAQRGKTCLVESDLRRPTFAETLGVQAKPGLTQVLGGSASLDTALEAVGEVQNLSVLPSGPATGSPEDLIESEQMKALLIVLRDKFEYVVIDSPPVIPYSDTRVLSTFADAVVLVGRYGFTTRRAVTRCAQILAEVGAPVMGFVLNDIDLESADYHYYNYGFSRRLRKIRPYTKEEHKAPGATPEPEPPIKKKSTHA